eukprot:CAMPEP_0178412098 /NCGR_PEP_ID=MMETSP0689_2-20121128/21836_1 /TAXON_ID=160604 /ORGANISM="Amphidinium massartii, Strain CS-259" /LENGTH=432 /DNA_ID=CAMNT_0020033327 /DNA_START=119 /DNA_END=1417 /DNA_ORIENTATION=+
MFSVDSSVDTGMVLFMVPGQVWADHDGKLSSQGEYQVSERMRLVVEYQHWTLALTWSNIYAVWVEPTPAGMATALLAFIHFRGYCLEKGNTMGSAEEPAKWRVNPYLRGVGATPYAGTRTQLQTYLNEVAQRGVAGHRLGCGMKNLRQTVTDLVQSYYDSLSMWGSKEPMSTAQQVFANIHELRFDIAMATKDQRQEYPLLWVGDPLVGSYMFAHELVETKQADKSGVWERMQLKVPTLDYAGLLQAKWRYRDTSVRNDDDDARLPWQKRSVIPQFYDMDKASQEDHLKLYKEDGEVMVPFDSWQFWRDFEGKHTPVPSKWWMFPMTKRKWKVFKYWKAKTRLVYITWTTTLPQRGRLLWLSEFGAEVRGSADLKDLECTKLPNGKGIKVEDTVQKEKWIFNAGNDQVHDRFIALVDEGQTALGKTRTQAST